LDKSKLIKLIVIDTVMSQVA